MKPIISPWLIYFAELADSINMAFLFVTFIAFIIMAFAFIPYMDNKKDETLKQCLKKSFIWFCISVAIVVMTPSKDTVYTMVVLDNVTTDNIQAIGKTGKDVVDYITEQIDKVVNEDDEKENN
ncbi:hypothetical protein [Blautia massiliensis (ex Durand et al. 2017)]|uniref:hypothetical protein n=1 Tax=Blautia massiliensis (ex Durand et al. 2017) TaxID=1737424 RepID=UPI00156FC3A1|nr:hypothetical protein [Blautia massiliensis (ex Durand et al. 2017)]NSK76853.1 hypothetical protein [Blautia massiliensis (ex Durand et al. 2017)]